LGVEALCLVFWGGTCPWRFAAAKLALFEKEHKSMIKLLNGALSGGAGPLHTRPASSLNVSYRRTIPLRDSSSYLMPDKPTLLPCQLSTWPALRCPVMDRPELALFCINDGEYIDVNSLVPTY
jgi:hypothetical protein